MKKIFCGVMAAMMLALTSCGNQQIFDNTYNFNKVMIAMPDGSIVSGKLSSWLDYENSEQIQLVIDGVTYLTHMSNVVMISD